MNAKIVSGILLALALLVGGCGGSGSEDGAGQTAYAGGYRSDFTRGPAADTTLFVAVDEAGGAKVVISDANGILYSGDASVDIAGGLVATANGAGGSVQLEGTFFQNEFLVDASGDLNLSGVAAGRFLNDGQSPFPGAYALSYDGDETGTAGLTIDASGTANGSLVSPSIGTVGLSGTTANYGPTTFTATGSDGSAEVTFTFSGNFFLTPSGVKGIGTWSSTSGDSGSWAAGVTG